MITRRTFIRSTTLAAVSSALAPGLLKAAAMKKYMGLQLYTVRDHIERDFAGTLKQVARTGYTWLEAAGYSEGKFYGMEPKELRQRVSDLGMEMISSHVSFAPEQSKQVIDAHLELGVYYLVYPWMSMPEKPSPDDYARKAELFNQLGLACRDAGLKFGYHNHAFEFVPIENTNGFSILLEQTDPVLVCFEADIYWMTFAGVDPMHYFSKYPGRFELWHVKDMDDSPEKGFMEVGEGVIPYGEYFKNAKQITGMKYFFVEQDSCSGDSLKSDAISFKNLKKLL